MKGDEIKQEFELIIKKEVVTFKKSLLETLENKQKKSQKELILSRKKILN